MSGVVHAHHIHIRSKDCKQETAGFNTDMTVELGAGIRRPDHHTLAVSLANIDVPWTWYSISAHLGTNALEVDGGASLVIPDGNYNINELKTAIDADVTFPYTMTFDSNSLKTTLTNTGADNTERTINFSSTASEGLAKALGFAATDVTVAASGTAVSTGSINLQTVHSLFLWSNLSVANVLTTENGNFEPILAKIPMTCAVPQGIVHYSTTQDPVFRANTLENEIRVIRLSLRDQNGKLVQLNGANFELTLLVQALEPKDSVHSKEAFISGLTSSNAKRTRATPMFRHLVEHLEPPDDHEGDELLEGVQDDLQHATLMAIELELDNSEHA